MDSILDDIADGERDEGDGTAPSYYELYDLTIGQVQVRDEDTGEQQWLWKVQGHSEVDGVDHDETVTCVSVTIFDAVMGCIEDITGGEV